MITSKFNGFNPYIFKAYYDYIVDHDDIPHLLVNPRFEGTVLPSQFAAAEELILSVSPNAVRGFVIGAKGLSFDTKFSGRIFSVFLPYGCIYEIIATESKIAIPIRVFFVSGADDEEDEDSAPKASDQGNDSDGFEILSDDNPAASAPKAEPAPQEPALQVPEMPKEEMQPAQESVPADAPQAEPQAPAHQGETAVQTEGESKDDKETSDNGEPDFTIV